MPFLRLLDEKRRITNIAEVTHAEFKERFLPLQPMLYREAYRVLCDSFEAEDAVQNLYVKLWERRNELGNLLVPEAYCRKLLRNICIDRWRLLRASEEDFDSTVEDVADVSPPEVEANETKECIAHFLSSLPLQQKRVMQMSMNGCSFEEIEKITGLTQVNIRVMISRLRKKFREFYNSI